MKENSTDNFFRSQLENYHSQVPEGLWEKLEEKRHTPVPLITPWIRMALIATMSVALLMAVKWFTDNDTTSAPKPTTESSAAIASNTPNPKSATMNNDIIIKNNNDHIIANTANSTIQKGTIINENPAATATFHNNAITAVESNSPNAPLDNISIMNNVITDVENKPTSQEQIREKRPSIGYGKPSVSRIGLSTLGKVHPLQTNNSHPTTALALRPVECATFGRKPYTAYLDLFVSPDASFRSLNANNDGSDFQAFADARNATERTRYAYTVGGRVSVILNNGLAFRVGATYHQINEKFEWQDPNAQQNTATGVSIDTLVMGVDTTFVIDTLYSTVYGLRVKKTYNKYKMIDFPLIIGYEINDGGNWTFSGNVGAYISVYAWYKGDALNETLQPQSFTTDVFQSQKIFKPSVGISLFASAGAYYSFAKHWQFMIEPHVRYYIKPISEDTYLLRQKYINAGLITGLRYRF